MNATIKYTKSDLQLSGDALIGAISQVGKELEKKNTPRGRSLNARLLENFNKYDTNQMTTMLNDFQRLLVESASTTSDKLNAEYVVEQNSTILKRIIMSES